MTDSLRAITIIAAGMSAAGVLATTGAGSLAASGSDDKVTICHSLDADRGYERLTISPSAVLSGHSAQHPEDIIPPFRYSTSSSRSGIEEGDDEGSHSRVFPGQNWGTRGHLTWNNRCVDSVPATPLMPGTPTPRMPDSQPFVPLGSVSDAGAITNALVTAVSVCRYANDSYSPLTLAPAAVLAALPAHVADIVPPFMYSGEGGVHAFPGHNWNAGGQQAWATGCRGMRTVSEAEPGEAVLRLSMTASRRRPAVGSRVTFRIVTKSLGPASARLPRVCTTVPKSLVITSAPKARVRGRAACWNSGLSAKGASARQLTVRVRRGMGGAMIHVNGLFTARNGVSYRALGTITPPR